MSEETSGALSGAASGASTGASVGTAIMPGIGTAIGAGVGALVGGIGGFLGGKKAKKRRQELERKIAAIKAKVAASVRSRLKEVDKLTDQQIKLADEQLDQALEYYTELQLKYQGMAERNRAEAELQYGDLIKQIEGNLQEELGIQGEVFDQYRTEVDDLYTDVRDLVQVDLSYNKELKEEFRTDADKAIRDTWEASEDAKVDLQQLKDSGGRPESFDRVVAENAKRFGQIETEIDRADAARGRSDLTGKKLTSKFAEAMAAGNIAGQMGEMGQRQEQALRGEVANLGNMAMNQQMAKLQGARADEGTTMANLAQKFRGQQIESTLREGMERVNMEQDANNKQLVAQEMHTRALDNIRDMLDRGEISTEEAKFAAERLNQDIKQQAKEANWEYKDMEARAHENAMLRTIGAQTKDLQAMQAKRDIDWAGIGSSVSKLSDLMGKNRSPVGTTPTTPSGGGGGGGMASMFSNFFQPMKPSFQDQTPQPTMGPLRSLAEVNPTTGGSTIPVNPYEQRTMGRYQNYLGARY